MFAPLVSAFRDWTRGIRSTLSLDECDSYEVSRMAREFGVTPSELSQMSKLPPDATTELLCRMAVIGLDAVAVRKAEPGSMRDMQRLCGACVSKKRCQRDLSGDRGEAWRQYCPNAGTLDALEQEMAQRH